MAISDQDLEFVAKNRSAAMITIDRNGVAKPARVGVGVVDGHIWSSGTQERVRTRRLRRDPRCTLYVYDSGPHWLAIESVVTILEGPDVPELSLRLARDSQGRPTGPVTWAGGEQPEGDFLQRMIDEHRLIYQFDPLKVYGLR